MRATGANHAFTEPNTHQQLKDVSSFTDSWWALGFKGGRVAKWRFFVFPVL